MKRIDDAVYRIRRRVLNPVYRNVYYLHRGRYGMGELYRYVWEMVELPGVLRLRMGHLEGVIRRERSGSEMSTGRWV